MSTEAKGCIHEDELGKVRSNAQRVAVRMDKVRKYNAGQMKWLAGGTFSAIKKTASRIYRGGSIR
ncbi:hypothetical protein [Salinicoccus sp. CNSTN-B1]